MDRYNRDVRITIGHVKTDVKFVWAGSLGNVEFFNPIFLRSWLDVRFYVKENTCDSLLVLGL